MSALQILALVLLLQDTLEQRSGVRIIGGSDCDEGQYPFMASLTYLRDHNCGCSIINPRWVLTAAHCVFSYPLKLMQIEYGSVNRDSPEVKKANVTKIVMHPEFQLTVKHLIVHDIALLKVDPEITLSEHVQVVKLPKMNAPTPVNEIGVAVGWGFKTRGHRGIPKTLQKLEMPILTDEECKDLWKDMFNPTYICAGDTDSELDKDVFHGDSGGPILVSDVQVGITSYGDERIGAPPYRPSLFTKVSLYVDWITEIVKTNETIKTEY